MDTSKIIKGVVNSGRYTVTAPIVKEDYGLYLQIEGVELPSTYEVDFSNSEHNGTSVTMIGNSDGVLIPHQFIDTGKDIFAFLYHVGEDYGRTVYKFRIPNKVRPNRTNEEPTPEEQSVIDQAIAALNDAVAQTAQDVIDADASAQSAQGYASQAETAKSDAQTFAQRSANSAQASADYSASAQASATASAQSASDAETARQATTALVAEAQRYANASEQSASASANSASQAQGFAQSASASAQSASGYASQADISANTASAKASEASTSASTASQKATEASQSAENALSYKTDAESAKTASQTAQGLAESARDSAVSAKTDAESARDDAVQAKEDAESAVASISGALAEKAPIITDTASGAIASFSDGADNLPLKSLVIDINPVQDLHGYDSPWPAGGGEQLIPYPYSQTGTTTINGITFDVIADGDIAISGTASANAQIDLCTNNYNTMLKLPAGDYTISVNNTNVRAVVTIYDGDGHSTAEYGTPASRVFNIPNDGSDYRCRVLLRVLNSTAISGTAHIAIKLQNGSLATAWSPYENICPISGWTEVDVEQSGVNVWDEEWENGYFDVNDGTAKKSTSWQRSKNVIRCLPNEKYCIRQENSGGSLGYVLFYDANGEFISSISMQALTPTTGQEITTPDNCHMLKMYRGISNNGIGFSVNHPSTDHDYHPYDGQSITIALGQTVYGGKLDVLSGVLTVDRYFVDPSQWTRYNASNGYIAYRILGIPKGRYGDDAMNEPISNMIAKFGGFSSSAMSKNIIQPPRINANTAYMALQDGIDPTTVELSYLMLTPITVQLTPNQVNSLLGVNNIWADSGDTTAEYRADTKLFIERLTAPDSADMVADANITSRQYFMVGNSLYKATANIANGSAIVVGTNAVRKSLSEALNEINA